MSSFTIFANKTELNKDLQTYLSCVFDDGFGLHISLQKVNYTFIIC